MLYRKLVWSVNHVFIIQNVEAVAGLLIIVNVNMMLAL